MALISGICVAEFLMSAITWYMGQSSHGAKESKNVCSKLPNCVIVYLFACIHGSDKAITVNGFCYVRNIDLHIID